MLFPSTAELNSTSKTKSCYGRSRVVELNGRARLEQQLHDVWNRPNNTAKFSFISFWGSYSIRLTFSHTTFKRYWSILTSLYKKKHTARKATRTSVNILYAILAQYLIFKYPHLDEYNKIKAELAAATTKNYIQKPSFMPLDKIRPELWSSLEIRHNAANDHQT